MTGACPACGGALSAWRTVPGSDPALAGEYELARCADCFSAVTIAPAPPQAHEAGAYGGGAPRGSKLAAPILDRFARRRLKMLGGAGAQTPGRLLDIGAGRGRFVAQARAAGWYAHGIEPSRRGVEGAQAIGVDLVQSGIDDAAVPAGSLDAAELWHVLEHLDDPGAALERIAGWLRPGGLLLVGVPNLASVQARAGGARWYHLDVPRHRTHFTVTGLHALLRRHGLDPVVTHHVLAEHNPFGLWQSVVSRVTTTPSWLYHALKRNAPLRSADAVISVAALVLAPLAVVAETLFGLARRGGTVAVVARRAGAVATPRPAPARRTPAPAPPDGRSARR